MNHVIAYELLSSELAAHHSLPFDELSKLVGEQASRTVRTGGVDYDLTIVVGWHHQTDGDIRVTGTI
jgi:hypothetical protein